MATTALRRKVEYISPTRQRVMGVLFLALAFSIWFFFSRLVDGEATTTFILTPGRFDLALPNWILPTQATLNLLATFSAFIGAAQLARARGFGRYTNLILAIVVGFFIFAFLTWAAANRSLNLAGLLNTTLSKAIPITLGALSGILCERAGVVNIAIEGMMLAAAMSASLIGSITNSVWAGLAAAILVGGLLGFVHAVLSIKYLVNQIVSGTVINIFSIGMTSYISAKFLQPNQALNSPGVFPIWRVPVLADIPFLGPILFNNNIFIYLTFIFLIVLHIALFYTRWGLRLRSVGEHPRAADTLGINVFKTRYMAVILGGMMAGVGGGYFTIGTVGRFNEAMTAGRGFIGLAAMIFGNWNPFGAFGAGLLFGFSDSLASRLAILNVQIPSQFLLMAPYVATMIVLAGVVGRGQMPAADGQPYEKE
jgi:general nucleoside transport system permease protein